MADWYCGSVQYTAVTQFAVLTAYSIGDIRRQLAAPAVGNERCFRCTTAGTSGGSESAWNLGKGVTTAQGTAVFTEVTGNSTYNWAAPHARLPTILSATWAAAGDRIFVAHNHAETDTANIILPGAASGLSAPNYIYCVNASGSVPPVSADLRTTATVTSSAGEIRILSAASGVLYFYGIRFSGTNYRIAINGSTFQELTFDNCLFTMTGGANAFMLIGNPTTGAQVVTLNNTPIVFGAATHSIYPQNLFIWKNTPSAIGAGSVPTNLFNNSSATAAIAGTTVILDGVDLSSVNTNIFNFPSSAGGNAFFSAMNCKFHASATFSATPVRRGQDAIFAASGSAGNCARAEKYTYDGTQTTETTIVRASGASDGITPISWKVVTTANTNKGFPFALPQIAIWNAATGVSKTATVEIVNDGVTLKDDEVWIEVEYLGASGTPLASVVSSRAVDHLTTGVNLTTSSTTWTTTGLSSPVKQKLSVSFTPQMAGLVRVTVYVAKVSQTLYIDPKVTIS